jgi:triosephosphate isomerase (TIM)
MRQHIRASPKHCASLDLTPARLSQEVHGWIRKWVTDNLSSGTADKLRVLYGGSVKGKNCNELACQEDIDGFLVGGASLDSGEFLKICNARSGAAAAA